MALSVDTPLVVELGDQQDYPMLVSGAIAVIYEGSAITLNGDGYAGVLVPGNLFVGHALRGVSDVGGASGDKTVRVRTGRYKAEVTLTSVAQTNVGDLVYMSDDGTYTLSSAGSAVKVGICDRYVAANTCVVEFYSKAATVL